MRTSLAVALFLASAVVHVVVGLLVEQRVGGAGAAAGRDAADPDFHAKPSRRSPSRTPTSSAMTARPSPYGGGRGRHFHPRPVRRAGDRAGRSCSRFSTRPACGSSTISASASRWIRRRAAPTTSIVRVAGAAEHQERLRQWRRGEGLPARQPAHHAIDDVLRSRPIRKLRVETIKLLRPGVSGDRSEWAGEVNTS